MATETTVKLNIELETNKAQSQLKKFSSTSKEIDKEMENTTKKASSLSGVLGKLGGAFLIGSAIRSTATEMRAFQQEFSKAETLMNGNVQASANAKKGINEMSAATGLARSEIAGGYYQALSSGIQVTDDMTQANKQVEVAMKLTKAGFTDTETAVDGLTTVLNAYGMSADETMKVSDIMIKTQDLGKVTVDEMARSLGNVIPVASDANVEFEQIGASYAVLTAKGMDANKSSTALRNIIGDLNNSSNKLGKFFEKTANKSFKQFIEEGGNVQEAIKLVRDEANKTKTPIGSLVGRETISAFNMLTTAGDEFNDALVTMQTSSGATDKNFETATNNINDNLAKIKETVLSYVVPALEKGSDVLNTFIGTFANLDKTDQQLLLLGATTIATTMKINSMAKAAKLSSKAFLLSGVTSIKAFGASLIALATNPVFLAIAGIAAIGVALYKVHANQQKATEGVREYGKIFSDAYNNIDISASEYSERMSSYNTKMQGEIENVTLALYQMRDVVDGEEYTKLANKANSGLSSIKKSLKETSDYHNTELARSLKDITYLDEETKKTIINNAKERGIATVDEAEKINKKLISLDERKQELLSNDNRSKKNQEELDKIFEQEKLQITRLNQLKENTVINEQKAQDDIMNARMKAGLLTDEQIEQEITRRKEAAQVKVDANTKTLNSSLAALTAEQDQYKKGSDEWHAIETAKNQQIDNSNQKLAEYTAQSMQSISELNGAKLEDLNLTTDANGQLQTSYGELTTSQQQAFDQIQAFYNEQPTELQNAMTKYLGINKTSNEELKKQQDATKQHMKDNPIFDGEAAAKQTSQQVQKMVGNFGTDVVKNLKGQKAQIQGGMNDTLDVKVDNSKGNTVGKTYSKDVDSGVQSGKGEVTNTVNNLLSDASIDTGGAFNTGAEYTQQLINGINSIDITSTGQEKSYQFVDGINQEVGKANEAGQSLGKQAKSGAESESSGGNAIGSYFGAGYVNGVLAHENAAYKAGQRLGNASKKGAADAGEVKSPSREMFTIGDFFGQGHVLGIENQMDNSYKAGKELGDTSVKGITDTLEIHSPSKKLRRIGAWTGLGFNNGMWATKAQLQNTATKLGKAVIKSWKKAISDFQLERIMSFNSVASLEQQKATMLRQTNNAAEKKAIIDYYNGLITAEKQASKFRRQQLQAEKKKNDVVDKQEKLLEKYKGQLDKAKTKKEKANIKKKIQAAEKRIRIAEQNYEITMSRIEDQQEALQNKKEAQEKLKQIREEAAQAKKEAQEKAEQAKLEAREKAAEEEAKKLEQALKERGLISPTIETGSSRVVNITSPIDLIFNISEVKNYDQFLNDVSNKFKNDFTDRVMGGKFI